MTKEKLAQVTQEKMAQLAVRYVVMTQQYYSAVAALKRWAAYQSQFVEA